MCPSFSTASVHFQFNQFRKFITFYIQLLKKKKFGMWKLSYQTCEKIMGEQLVYNCGFTLLFFFLPLIALKVNDLPTLFFFVLLFLLPRARPPQRILCSTSALAMFEPGLGSCCRLDSRSSLCDRSLSSKSLVRRRASSNAA